MAYQSLYRKYRPQTFEDVVGQEPVVRTLVNAIREDRLHHAYLFTGPRGTGKTSTARILAKAVNCEQGPTPEPCGACAMCVAIREGNAVDVVELDMASHGGVDDARELRERALFAPAQGRRKVYILDEVHMASSAAFNALLKLIEEPPAHVLFTMATTDPQKVLPTIMSRVQRLDLRRVGARELGDHVRMIARSEGHALDEDAVDAVVRAGDGSVRDTMSILEQVLAFAGGTVTGDDVAKVLGTTPAELTFQMVDRLAAQDLGGALAGVQELLDGGRDLRRFALDLVGHLRDLLVLQVAPGRPDLVDTTDERRAQLAEQAAAIPRETVVRAVDLLADALVEMRQGPPRLPLELVLAKVALPTAAGDTAALADRLARLEAGGGVGGTGSGASASAAPAQRAPAEQAPAATEEAPKAAPDPQTAPDAADEGADEGDRAAAQEPEAPEEADPQAPSAPAEDAAGAPEPAEEAPPPASQAPAEDAPPVVSGAPTPADDDGSARDENAVLAGENRVPRAVPAAGSSTDPLVGLRERWPAVLEQVRERSKRCHAIFSVAHPVELTGGVLTLGFGPQHEGFHARQAPRGDYATTLQDVLEPVLGSRPVIEARIVSGGPPPSTSAPGGAAPSVARADDRDTLDEEALDVAEAEAAPPAEDVDESEALARAADLVERELDAERLE